MLNPFLIIGLGGSGGKTLQTLQDNLMRQLRQAGWDKEKLPNAWQLLQIDVPPSQGEVSGDLPGEMTGDSYVGLVTPGTHYSVVDAALSDRLATNELARQAMAGWRPSPDAVNVPIERGAGQYRAIGRFLTVYHIERVKKAIDDAIIRMNSLSSEAELKEIAGLLRQETDTAVGQPTAVVVASIAGGTGAGMFMDVCDVLRATGNTWAGESMAMFFTPDVFDELPVQSRAGVRPNALASLNEILAGFWDQDGFGEDETALLQLAGVAPRAEDNRVGPRFPFLLGRSNGSITFERQNDVYRSAGRALSSWVLSDQIQSVMSNYITGNWVQSSLMADRAPFKDQGQENPFQALGFARVTLGRDRFLQYSSERLARGSIERLLEGHLEGKAFDDHRADSVILEERVNRAYPDFLAASGLDINPDHAVKVILGNEGFKAINNRITGLLLRRAFSAETELTGHDLVDRSTGEANTRRQEFDDEFSRYYTLRLQTWADSAQRDFIVFMLEQAATHGVPATGMLAEKLSAHIRSVNARLVDKARESAAAAAHRDIHIPLDDAIPGDSAEAREIVGGIARKETSRNIAEALEAFAGLLDEFRCDVIDPARDALTDATAELKSQQSAADSWPSFRDNSVPERLRPTPNERSLLSPEGFSDQLDELLMMQFQVRDRLTARDEALKAVIAFPEADRAASVENLLAEGGRWVPADPRARSSRNAQPRKLSIRIDLRPRALRRHSEKFVEMPNTALGRFVREDLSDFLSAAVPAEELTRRLRVFDQEFSEAMRASAPMASINPNVVMRIHESDVGVIRVFSGVPFPRGSEAYKVAEKVLTAMGLDESARAGAFREVKSQHIDIFAMLASPMEPIVFDSLTKPIKEQWDRASSAGADALAEFWRFRRTRPLPQSIPMAPYVRRSMVRGWFTARVMGQLQDTMDATGAGDLAIFDPSPGAMAGTWKSFALPLLLPQGAGPGDRLAGVLKSAAIAMLDASIGDMQALEAYARLRSLGAARNGSLSVYHTANTELEQWVLNGVLRPGAPEPRPDWAGTAGGSVEIRRELMITRLRTWRDNYSEKVFRPVDELRDLGMAPRSWELRRDYLGALDELIGAIRKLDVLTDEDL